MILPCPIHVTAAVAMNRRDADARVAEVLGLRSDADPLPYRVLVADDGRQVFVRGDKTAIVELWRHGARVPFKGSDNCERSVA